MVTSAALDSSLDKLRASSARLNKKTDDLGKTSLPGPEKYYRRSSVTGSAVSSCGSGGLMRGLGDAISLGLEVRLAA